MKKVVLIFCFTLILTDFVFSIDILNSKDFKYNLNEINKENCKNNSNIEEKETYIGLIIGYPFFENNNSTFYKDKLNYGVNLRFFINKIIYKNYLNFKLSKLKFCGIPEHNFMINPRCLKLYDLKLLLLNLNYEFTICKISHFYISLQFGFNTILIDNKLTCGYDTFKYRNYQVRPSYELGLYFKLKRMIILKFSIEYLNYDEITTYVEEFNGEYKIESYSIFIPSMILYINF